MHAERLLQSICVPRLVMIAQAVFPFRAQTNRQTNKQTDATERSTHARGYDGMGNNNNDTRRNNRPSSDNIAVKI